MKKSLITMLIAMCSTIVVAQQQANDVIITNDAKRIEANITQVSSTEIQYHEAGFDNGPLFVLKTDEISSITFSNGQVKIYQHQPIKETQAQIVSNNAPVASVTSQKSQTELPKVTFRSYIDVAAIFGREAVSFENSVENVTLHDVTYTVAGPAINIELGAFIHNIVFVGAGFGFHGLYANFVEQFSMKTDYGTINGGLPTSVGAWLAPIYANAKFYFLKKQFSPFADVSFGGCIGVAGKTTIDATSIGGKTQTTEVIPDNGFYCRVGLGGDFKHFVFGVGYECLKFANAGVDHLGYVKLGVRIGK